jgi:transposase
MRTPPSLPLLQLEDALDGVDTFTDHHAFVLGMMLDNIDHLTTQVDKLTAQVEDLMAPLEGQVAELDGVTGIGRTGAQDLIAEIGVDMSVFATAAHPVPWAKFCPQVKQSAGKRKVRNARGKGNRYLASMLGEASVTAGRTQTRLGARYRRLAKRRGTAKAQVAVGNTVLTIAHALLSDPAADYKDLGPDYYDKRTHHRREVTSHLRSLQRLGYKVTLEPTRKAA